MCGRFVEDKIVLVDGCSFFKIAHNGIQLSNIVPQNKKSFIIDTSLFLIEYCIRKLPVEHRDQARKEINKALNDVAILRFSKYIENTTCVYCELKTFLNGHNASLTMEAESIALLSTYLNASVLIKNNSVLHKYLSAYNKFNSGIEIITYK